MYVRDVYQGLEPEVARGEIDTLVVVQEMAKPVRALSNHQVNAPGYGFRGPVISCGAAFAPKKVWGFADVEEDGSAYFTVPA